MFGTVDRNFKPVQLYQINAVDGVSCRVFSPSESLLGFIHYYWLLDISASHVDLPVIPDNAVDLVLSPDSESVCALYFPQAEKYEIPLEGPAIYIGTCFHIQNTSRLFGKDIEELRQLTPGEQTALNLGLQDLLVSIQGVKSGSIVQDRLNQFFAEFEIDQGEAEDQLFFSEFVGRLEPATIRTLAASVGLSDRQFRRLTTNLYGLSPKKLQRVTRLQNALNALLQDDRVPGDEGFYDDSHKISELKKLTGMTPTEIRRMAENYNHSSS